MSADSGIESVLVVRNDNVGDVLCSTPAIEALKRSLPKARIGVLVADYTRPVLEGNPFVDRVYSYAKAKHGAGRWESAAGLIRVIRAIRADSYDAAVAMRSKLTPVLSGLVRLSGARIRVGFRPSRDRRRLGRRMTLLIDPPREPMHEAMRCMILVRALVPDSEPGAMRVTLSDSERDGARSLLVRHSLDAGIRPICVHVSSRREVGREWPTEHYIRLIDQISSAGMPVVLNCVPHEKGTGEAILRRIRTKVPIIDAGGLRELAALFAECAAVVSIDGGGAHLAAAAGAPTIAIFNGGDPAAWSPWGENHRVVASRSDDADVRPERVAEAVLDVVHYS